MALNKDFFTHHIKGLNEVLERLYTIKKPVDYKGSKDDEINVKEELETAKELERLYSSIEKGFPAGEVFKKYSGFLVNVRKGIEILEVEKEKIEEEHSDDIENAELLIKVFEKHLD